ncbi:TetR/AcrR family transcriptional regulator [Symbioplanes lichenis]|uniref:TetR/AcrR family transcriptional regulator n=1 Tax=Symbioplanes lichenis TaxID=1629072 RepID=UPI00273A06D7|nr:TetR/AcrR family transcriptional regulator [Actinoplanes lichenis]
MRRPTRQEIDDEIVDQAAALFARHGLRETSVQRIADAAGYSKTGLLHRFPSKEALWEAVSERCTALLREVAACPGDLPPGPERDRAVLSALADVALAHPGMIALVLSAFSRSAEPGDSPLLDEVGEVLFAAFSVPADLPDVARGARVVGALGALAVAALALRDLPAGQVREHLVALSSDTLGHPRPAL